MPSAFIAEKDQTNTWTDYVYAGGKKIARLGSNQVLHHFGTCQPSVLWCPASNFTISGLSSGLANYPLRQGDKLMFLEKQTNAESGLYMYATDGTNSVNTLYDAAGDSINWSSIADGQWHSRSVDMSPWIGKTISSNLGLSLEGVLDPTVGYDAQIADVALVSADGTIIPVYSGQSYGGQVWDGNAQASYEDLNTNAQPVGEHYFLADALGTTQLEFASGGWPIWRGEFAPFGQELDTQPTQNHYKFTGKERDSESGLDYFGARYYGSSMGRFMSPDWSGASDPVPYASLENPQTLNLYAYVENNPLSRTDPFGHASDPCGDNKDTCVTVTAKPDNGPCLITLGLAWGHHFIDRAVVAEQNAQNSLAGRFFSRWMTGPLKKGGVHSGFPNAARLSQDQVRKIVNDVVSRSGKTMSEWGQAEINEAVEEVRTAGGDTGAFLNSIAQENPGVRTAQADVQDVMNAAKSAMDVIKANANPAAIEEDVKDIIVTCKEGGCPPP